VLQNPPSVLAVVSYTLESPAIITWSVYTTALTLEVLGPKIPRIFATENASPSKEAIIALPIMANATTTKIIVEERTCARNTSKMEMHVSSMMSLQADVERLIVHVSPTDSMAMLEPVERDTPKARPNTARALMTARRDYIVTDLMVTLMECVSSPTRQRLSTNLALVPMLQSSMVATLPTLRHVPAPLKVKANVLLRHSAPKDTMVPFMIWKSVQENTTVTQVMLKMVSLALRSTARARHARCTRLSKSTSLVLVAHHSACLETLVPLRDFAILHSPLLLPQFWLSLPLLLFSLCRGIVVKR